MTFIASVADDEAEGTAAEYFDADRARLGYVPNYTRLFAHRSDVYTAWRQLVGSITENMDAHRYELATIAAARRLRLTSVARESADRSLLRAVRLARHRGRSPLRRAERGRRGDDGSRREGRRRRDLRHQADVQRLRGLGLSDAEILDVVLASAARCFFSKTLDALGVEADAALAEFEPGLREVLTVGRPIASG